MKIKDCYDVIIVGAGPAGAMAALKLAKNKTDVLLVERCKMPRNKTCTGMIDIESITIINEEVGAFPKGLCVWPYEYRGFRYKMAKGAPIIHMGIDPNEVCYSVKRRDFDHWLAIEASKAGAEVVDKCMFVGFDSKEKDSVA